uniref:Uncharacterized protein n=1 Tax=Magallana gigas TaxID=29159 RepID=K1QB66_MAGGI
MEKVPTLREVSIQLQSTTIDIRLKNAQLAGVIEYLDAGYEPHVAHILPRKPTVELECRQILVDFHFVKRKKGMMLVMVIFKDLIFRRS